MTTLDTTRHDLEKRLDGMGWGLFFVMSGLVLLAPALPDGTWLAGVGTILVGFSAARLLMRLPVSPFAAILGGVLFVSGAGTIAGLAVPGFALLLLACGVALVAGTFVQRASRLA